MDYKIRGGNSLLAQKLADAIGPQHIKLHHTVTEVSQTTHNITLTCSGGATFTADYLICTAPTNAVLNIRWSPTLPRDILQALQELQYCRINKHAVLFSERFWGQENFDLITDTYAHYLYHGTKNQKSQKSVLISYTVGDKADVLGRQNQAFQTEVIKNSLRPAFSDISSKILKHANNYWGNDPYAQGAYAIYGRGQWFTLMPILKKPFLRTHFAGEHLADWQGFMEGTITTGEDAADTILHGWQSYHSYRRPAPIS
jgi:monoamine oxidase